MAGLNGRDVNVAFARGTTWGTPASVTKQLNLRSLDGFDAKPMIVTDEGFNQDFVGEGQIGDYAPSTPELVMDLRYDGAAPIWLAAACGSSAAPAVVSSQAAGSLVAESHVITLANDLTKFFTLAADYGGAGPGGTNYILEIPSAKPRGFTIRVGENGKMQLSIPLVGSKTVYTSAINTNSTVGGATVDALSGRVFRRNGVYRMNMQSAGSLVAADAHIVKELTFGTGRPLSDADHVFGQDYIIEADDDGFAEFPVDIVFAVMTSANANSLVVAWPNGTHLKADATFTSATYINSTTPYSMKFEWPALQITEWSASVTGHSKVRPQAKAMARMATVAPANMAFTAPMRVTVVNVNSSNLLV